MCVYIYVYIYWKLIMGFYKREESRGGNLGYFTSPYSPITVINQCIPWILKAHKQNLTFSENLLCKQKDLISNLQSLYKRPHPSIMAQSKGDGKVLVQCETLSQNNNVINNRVTHHPTQPLVWIPQIHKLTHM